MNERTGIVTLKGNGVTLVGKEIKVGDKIPDCTVSNFDLQPVSLAASVGSPLLLMSVPSLDTPVCSLETKRFNQEFLKLSADMKGVVISMDLPFAQKRWCAAEGLDRLQLFSDYRLREFGERFGLYIKEVGLLARALFVVDRSGVVRYREIVPEMTNEPNYKVALEKLKEVAL